MSEVPAELVWLLERLRSTPSRRGRLRLLLEAWQNVRGLSPTDRLLVARELGFDGAERLVEEVAHRGSVDASPWLEMLDEAERSEPEELSEVVRGLADPRRRAATVGRLLEGAGAWLAGSDTPEASKAGEPAWVQQEAPGDRRADDEADGAEVGDREEVRRAAIEAAPEPVVEEAAVVEPAGAPPEPSAESPPEAAAAPAAAAGTAAAGAVGDEPGALQPERRHRQPPVEAASFPLIAELPTGSGAAEGMPRRVGDAGVVTLLAELTGEPRVQRRLARLGRSRDAVAVAALESVEAVLRCFPPGWARRRALQRLLEAGIPASLADAVALLGLLERPSERLWAATTLMESRVLEDDNWKAVLEAVASPAVRRRLEWRRARARGRDRT